MNPGLDLEFRVDELSAEDVRSLLRAHLAFAHEVTPPGHVHALGEDGLSDPSVTFVSARHHRVSLETGTGEPFAPARTLYRTVGFVPCEPFGDYTENPNSVCMTLDLRHRAHPAS